MKRETVTTDGDLIHCTYAHRSSAYRARRRIMEG